MGNKTEISDQFFDKSRYGNHKQYIAPDNNPILIKNHNYIIIWGHWNSPDEKLAIKDGDYYEPINALRAYKKGIISRGEYFDLIQIAKQRFFTVGIEDINLRGNHLIISFNSKGKLVTDRHGEIEIRVCNFEFLKNHRKNTSCIDRQS